MVTRWSWAEGKKSASGSPKRHRASLSAATGEVLTRFARRRPSDLRHPQYNRHHNPSESCHGRSPQHGALPLQHLPELPGFRHHGTEQKDNGSVVDPENEEHDRAKISIPAQALERGEI